MTRGLNPYLNLRQFITETRHRSPALWGLILIQLLFISISLIAIGLDPRTIKNGVSPWLKPIIFDLSVITYAWAMIWAVSELPKHLNRSISRQVAASLLIVTSFIVVQSIRGVKTSFNPSDSATLTIFVIFGVAIAWNTFLLFRTAFHFRREPLSHLNPVYKRGIQLGLYSIIVGSLIGHAIYFASIDLNIGLRIPGVVGSLPSLNFVSRIGSLRIAHSLGLHGLQIFMIIGAILSRVRRPLSETAALKTMNILFVLSMVIIFVSLAWAIYGIPHVRGAS